MRKMRREEEVDLPREQSIEIVYRKWHWTKILSWIPLFPKWSCKDLLNLKEQSVGDIRGPPKIIFKTK